MRRIIGVIFLLIGPVLLQGLIACDTCNPTPYRFSILNYKTYPRKIFDPVYKPYAVDTLALHDSVGYRQLELILIGQDSAVAMNNQVTGGATLWACSPAYIALDTIQHLNVTTNQRYRTGLEAGSSLASIITIGEGAYDQTPLTQFLAMPSLHAQPFYSLRFTQAPEQASRYQFLIKVDWGRGKTANFSTRPIYIKP